MSIKSSCRKTKWSGSHDTFLAHVIIGGVISWIENNNYEGNIAYFFEFLDTLAKLKLNDLWIRYLSTRP